MQVLAALGACTSEWLQQGLLGRSRLHHLAINCRPAIYSYRSIAAARYAAGYTIIPVVLTMITMDQACTPNDMMVLVPVLAACDVVLLLSKAFFSLPAVADFRCRWAGMDVAVKVIQHDASALEAVENEVQLQMYLNHPNIVSGTAARVAQLCVSFSGGGGGQAVPSAHAVV
jgi:hypothetical protein